MNRGDAPGDCASKRGAARDRGGRLGRPRLHRRRTGSTNADALALAAAGAPHGTLVTASLQTAGRGRQGRSWLAPAGSALLCSVVVRSYDALLPLRAGLAAAEAVGAHASVKWPNDVLLGGLKVAGVLVEAEPRGRWAVVGLGVNVALDPALLPSQLQGRAGTLGRRPDEVDALLAAYLDRLTSRLGDSRDAVLAGLDARDALLGKVVAWQDGEGVACGLDPCGGLVVRHADGRSRVLRSGEVHLRAEV